MRLAAMLVVGVFRLRHAVTHGQILLCKLDLMLSTVPEPGAASRRVAILHDMCR
jgi:hypothetical protein